MVLVPIKLLKNKVNRNKLLKIKGENAEIDNDDYIESRINTDKRARDLLAIEDASEIAKYYLHKKGVFEQIAKDIQKESKKKFNFMFRKTTKLEKTKLSGLTTRSGVDYVLMEHSYPDGSGHYGMARIDHDKKVAKIYDSMTDNESDFEEPLKHFLGKAYKTTTGSIFGCVGRMTNAVGHNLNPQPTGGFVSQSFNEFKHKNFAGGRGGVPKKYMEDAFTLSQYDEMSQHHFCYMESLHAMMADLGLAHPGPQDPRERLEYIKRFIWGIIHKYVSERSRKTIQWKYFENYFPYILETMGPGGKRLTIRRGYIQVPPTRGKVQYRLKKMRTTDKIDGTTPLSKITKWAKGTRKWLKT
jgi:hypothetical protein